MKLLITLLTFVSFSFISFGQDAKAQAILDKLSTKMKGQSSFYIEFSANIKNSSTGTNESETGKGGLNQISIMLLLVTIQLFQTVLKLGQLLRKRNLFMNLMRMRKMKNLSILVN